MDYIPDLYKDIPLGIYEKAPCSPAVPSSDWSGVIITGPQRIIPEKGETPVVPICGYFFVPVLDAMDGSPLTVHVRQVDTTVVISGVVNEEGPNEPVEPPPPDAPRPNRDAFKGVSTGGYFNIDAQRYLQQKLIPSCYEVTVSYAGAHSNPIQIEIVPP